MRYYYKGFILLYIIKKTSKESVLILVNTANKFILISKLHVEPDSTWLYAISFGSSYPLF